MPSSWSPSLRLELQYTGENINLWGDKLNAALTRIDNAVAGWVTVAVNGPYTLTAANGAADEARSAMLKFTGAGGAVTIPSVSKSYTVWNACTGDTTLTTGAASTATLAPGEICSVVCDGSNVKRVGFYSMQSQRLRDVANPTAAQDAATKAYVDGVAWSYNAGNLPGLEGSDGRFLKVASGIVQWTNVTVADVTDYANDQATKLSQAKAFALSAAALL